MRKKIEWTNEEGVNRDNFVEFLKNVGCRFNIQHESRGGEHESSGCIGTIISAPFGKNPRWMKDTFFECVIKA